MSLSLIGLVLLAAPLVHAQTNAPDASPTNAPADTAPLVHDTPPTVAPASAPPVASPQINPLNGSGSGNVSPQENDIEDIRPPFFFLHSWLWLWIALGVVGAIILIVLLWMWLAPQRLLSPKTAYDLTLEKLEKARALLREENPMPYAILVSEAIRTYLGQRFGAPSSRRTTEEFLRQMESDRATPLAEYRELLRSFLQSCDLVKFARYQPTLKELEEVQQRAFNFVTATKPISTPGHRNGSRP